MADDGQQEMPDRVIKLWQEYQTELQRGITDYAKRAQPGDLASDEAGPWRRHAA